MDDGEKSEANMATMNIIMMSTVQLMYCAIKNKSLKSTAEK